MIKEESSVFWEANVSVIVKNSLFEHVSNSEWLPK